MIHTLQLQNFRGIESVNFDDLALVNLIVGGNNTGKTSILEALTLMYGDRQQLEKLHKTLRPSPYSNNDADKWTNFWPRLFLKENHSNLRIMSDSALVSGEQIREKISFYREVFKDVDGEKFVVASDIIESKPFVTIKDSLNGEINDYDSVSELKLAILSTTQPDPRNTSRLFNEIAPLNPDNETKLEELLREAIEPRLKRLRYAKFKNTNEHLVYVDLGSGPMIPFTQMGQGFARALHIYCEIFSNQPDILLIDEIENGLYYEGLEDFWKGLFTVLKDQNVQLFATTHSRECMEAASKADISIDEESMLRFLRLDRHVDTGKIIGTSFDSDVMFHAVEFDQEMR